MSLEQMDSLLRAGLARSGMAEVAGFLTEIEALTTLLAAAESGDVIGLMCHVQRAEVADLIAQRGGTVDDPRTIRSKVIAARGMHEAEDDIAAIWALTDAGERVTAAGRLATAHPSDPRLAYEWACAIDATADRARAVSLYHRALDNGLREPHRHRAQLQAAAAYRDLGHPEIALELLEAVAATHPGSSVAAALRALVLVDTGDAAEAVADLVDALMEHATDETLRHIGRFAPRRRPVAHRPTRCPGLRNSTGQLGWP
jgi:cyanophycin synthetase